jgi:acyl-coenzyme A thioesterase PaaI-like protein
MCLVCGVENPSGLKARFFELETGELLGMFRPKVDHQSYPGRLHGGVASAMLDETIGRAINVADTHTWGVTIEFRAKFRKAVPLGADLKVIGRITRDSDRVFEGMGEILLPDGSVAVEGWGKYLKMPLEDVTDVGFSEREWFPDEAPWPADA